MLGLTKAIPAFHKGDWRTRLIIVAQILIGVVAVVGLLGMMTLHPYLLLSFATLQGLLVLGVALFAVAAIFAQRAFVPEDYEAGEIIFNEGEPGRHLYVISSGTVEVLMKGPDGVLRLIKELGPGDHFGEMALLGNVPRNATVRTKTRVEVVKMGRSSFAAIYTSLPGVKEHFSGVMESRLKEFQEGKRRP